MPVICPAILGDTKQTYDAQVRKIAAFAHRIQIDLTDGKFAPSKTVEPQDVWWPVGVKADIHLMYEQPLPATKQLVAARPNLIIAHAEAGGSFSQFAAVCREAGIKVGIALLARTSAREVEAVLAQLDHVMIFSGHLGYEGGSSADLTLLQKAKYLKGLKPDIEIGWDGGVNAQNVSQLVFGGVDVLNVGGFIQSAQDSAKAYETLVRIADETGET